MKLSRLFKNDQWPILSAFTAILSSLIFQGTLYMNWVERGTRLLVQLFLSAVWLLLLLVLIGGFSFKVLWVTLALTHIFMWFFFGQPWVAGRRLRKVTDKKWEVWQTKLATLTKDVGRLTVVGDFVMIGSVQLKNNHGSSDFDVRFIPSKGWGSAVACGFIILYIRLQANLASIPLDIFLGDSVGNWKSKIEKGELEVIR